MYVTFLHFKYHFRLQLDYKYLMEKVILNTEGTRKCRQR